MSTVTGHPVSYDSNYSAYSVSGLSQGETDSSSTNYATINLTRGSRAETVIFYNFDLDIPEGVTINSVSCTAKCYISSTSSSRIATRQVQLYSGNTAKGSAATVSNSTSVFNVTAGNWTASELNNAKIRIYAQRGTSNTSTNYYYRFYGATITVEYTEASSGNKVFIKKNGSWTEASNLYIKVNSTWQEVSKVYEKTNGTWQESDDKSKMFNENALYIKNNY